jgi:hypothetical protein
MFGIRLVLPILLYSPRVFGQYEDLRTVKATVAFDEILRVWDGFGVNYVQTAHTRDYSIFPQEYGGFSLLDEKEKEEIIELIFGPKGIKPALVKMFLDPLHQQEPGGPFDHETTTEYMLEFFDRGWEKTKSWGGDLQIITTLYSPPAFTTLQKELRGRDMDPGFKKDIALYMIDWARYLNEKNYPVKYISLHNEGEDWRRWAVEGDYANFDHGHDYNMYWRPEEVADFLSFMPDLMKKQGLKNVGLTPGECSRFFQFYYSGYAKAILDNPEAFQNLSLITSHNFYRIVPPGHRWFAGTSNIGTDMIREIRPGMKAWVTSASWGNMDVNFIWQIWMNIYLARINGYIPWACIQRPQHWVNKDPNPGTAIVVSEDGSYKIQRGYYLYKQISQAGQPGMGIAYTSCMDSEIQMIGFSSNGTVNPDAFIVINIHNYVPTRSDAVDITINETNFIFSNQDPALNKTRQMEIDGKYAHVNSESVRTADGYHLEVSIPWKVLNINPSTDPELSLKFKIREGAYSLAGELIWEDNEAFNLSENNENSTILPHTDKKPEIDGKAEDLWHKFKEYRITKQNHPNTDPDLNAFWQACHDREFLYFFIRIFDKTNLQGRKVTIDLQGTPYNQFRVIRSVDDKETYRDLGIMEAEQGMLTYEIPSRSVTSFIGIKE